MPQTKNKSLLIRWGLFIIVLIFSGCSLLPFLPKTPSQQFDQFVEDYFNSAFSVHTKPSKPFDWLRIESDSLDAVGAVTALSKLRLIDTSSLSVDERIDWLQLEASVKRRIFDTSLHDAMEDPGRYLTLGGLYWKIEGKKEPTAKDWSEILKTIQDAPTALALGRAQLQEPPPLWIKLAANTAKRYEDFLNGPLIEKVNTTAPDSLKEKLLNATKETALSLASYRRFLQDTLTPGPEDCWKAGTEYYDWLLREFHFLPYTSATMIETGWRIHNETKELLHSLAHRIDPSKSLQQVLADLKTRHPEPHHIAEAYFKESERVRSLILTHNLVTIPEPETLLFVPTPPALRETYAWGGYGGIVNRDGVKAGRFFVTDIVPDMTTEQIDEKLRAQNNGWVTVIALHEGYPGHHLQTLYAMNAQRKVRSRLGSTYYGEGWALYAESWMARAGFYENADDSLAWLQMRLWRTTRVIVDPSIHTGRMTYEQAVQFMVDEVGLERSAAEAEVNRYTTWPTQAASYIIGWLEIERLKEDLQKLEGSRFDEKKFVETLLSVGSLPLELMRRALLHQYGYNGASP